MLTPHSHENMRRDSTLNVTPERSPGDLPATVGGVEEIMEGTHPVSKERPQVGGPSTNITSTEETPETHLKVAPEKGSTQVESPRRIQMTREASTEDAIALTRHFFATVNGQNRVTTELPAEITTDVSEGNALHMNIPAVPATPIIETETTEVETRSPRTFLPNGSPRPTATATCRLQTWVQHVSEGQINEPTREGEDSTE